jgi:pyruvate dehydrogenase E2 component (dihydrolipoamide acetyltransferase)
VTLDDVRRAERDHASANSQPREGAPTTTVASGAAEDSQEPMSPLRSVIARRMTASQLIPQYQLQRDVDVTRLLAQKDAQTTASDPVRVSVNDLLIQALAEMVVRHPHVADMFIAAEGSGRPALRHRANVDIGLAVATDRGLIVPVIRRASELGLRQIATERARLVAGARRDALDLSELSGGVLTLSNLGGLGIDRFTAMLNPGESAIAAVGRSVDRLVPRGRAIETVPIMTVTMTFDHRVIDGAVGAEALAELAALLEGDMTWRP